MFTTEWFDVLLDSVHQIYLYFHEFQRIIFEGAALFQRKAYSQAVVKLTEALGKVTLAIPKTDIIACHMRLAETLYRQVAYQESLHHFERSTFVVEGIE